MSSAQYQHFPSKDLVHAPDLWPGAECLNKACEEGRGDVPVMWQPRVTKRALKSYFYQTCQSPTKKGGATAYLDGLRGFAALVVYWHHHELWVHSMDRLAQNDIFENGYGYHGKQYFVAVPGIRVLFSGGHFAVAVFFVLSGYVLSIKPHILVENDKMRELVQTVSSSIFRRWLRLFLPVLATVLIYATAWHILGLWVADATPHGSWFSELWAMYCEFKNFSFVYKEGGVPWLSYNMHLWSIPAEFKGSMVVFVAHIALSQCRRQARIVCELALIVYFMWITDGWYCAMFMAGMLVSHMDCLAARGRLPATLQRLQPARLFICYHLLAGSLYLGGVPCENMDLNQLSKNRGWYFLSFLKPQAVFDYKWFYLFWAAIGLIISIRYIIWLRNFFESRFCQYLGRISYGLYLVHGPILWTIGDRLYALVGISSQVHWEKIPSWVSRIPVSRAGPVGLEFSFLLAQLLLLPLTLWLASFVTGFIDQPSAQLASWLYSITLSRANVRDKTVQIS